LFIVDIITNSIFIFQLAAIAKGWISVLCQPGISSGHKSGFSIHKRDANEKEQGTFSPFNRVTKAG